MAVKAWLQGFALGLATTLFIGWALALTCSEFVGAYR